MEKEKQHFPSLSFCSIDSPLALVAANKVRLSIENMVCSCIKTFFKRNKIFPKSICRHLLMLWRPGAFPLEYWATGTKITNSDRTYSAGLINVALNMFTFWQSFTIRRFSSSDGTLLVPSLWSRSFGLSPFGGMMECHTYSPMKQKFVPGYPEMVKGFLFRKVVKQRKIVSPTVLR